MAAAGKNRFALNLRAGEIVEIRSKEEILATLDEKGRLDGLPFMPEMLKYCGQYVKDVTSGNVTVLQVIEAMLFRIFQLVLRIGAYRALTQSYNVFQRMRGGTPYPFREGTLTSKTPSETLNLQPGELVQVKSHEEILQTLNKVGRNRAM